MKGWHRFLNRPLEEAVSRHRGRTWLARDIRDLSEFACHPCAVISDGAASVFAKYSDAPDAVHQFEVEQAGLEYLSARAGVLIPTPVAILPLETGALFIAEALDEVDRGPLQWRQIGRTLARIHHIRSDQCGFHMKTYFGPLEQDNTPTEDWATFYRERRLLPFLKLAVDSGNLSRDMALQVEKVIRRLPELCGPAVSPRLLHGDAQKNNFISTRQGACVIDPAVYYGHPEVDLAYIDYFESVPWDVFAGYREEMPIDAGFDQRRNLWRIHGYLAAVAVEGREYCFRLANAIRDYL